MRSSSSSQFGGIIVECALCVPLLWFLVIGVLGVVGGLEAYQNLSSVTYAGARLAAVDAYLAEGTFIDLAPGAGCEHSQQNPCTGHPSTQAKMKWLVNLYNDSSVLGFVAPSTFSSSLQLSVSQGSLPQPSQGLAEAMHDITLARLDADYEGPLKLFPLKMTIQAWVPYLYERRVVDNSSELPTLPPKDGIQPNNPNGSPTYTVPDPDDTGFNPNNQQVFFQPGGIVTSVGSGSGSIQINGNSGV